MKKLLLFIISVLSTLQLCASAKVGEATVYEGGTATLSLPSAYTTTLARATGVSYQWTSASSAVSVTSSSKTWATIRGNSATSSVRVYYYCSYYIDGYYRTMDFYYEVKVIASTVYVNNISLNYDSRELYVGSTLQLYPTIYPSNATNKAVTWQSNNSSVASVNSNGLVTANGIGSTYIYCYAADGSGTYARCYITVTSPTVYVSSISLNHTNEQLSVGNTLQLSATVYPSNATNKSVTWRSDDSSVASVNSSGLVTAKAPGSTYIYCTAKDGSGTFSRCYVTVSVPSISINETNFPDENFRSYLLSQSYGNDGILTSSEIASITELYIYNKDIGSLEGIQFFTALKNLGCGYNHLSTLDVTKNINIESLYCYNNQLTSLDVTHNTSLLSIDCSENQLTSLDVTHNTSLVDLICHGNHLSTLDVTKNIALRFLSCPSNKLSSLKISNNNGALRYLVCNRNKIKGEEMNVLVNSLPTVSDGRFSVFSSYPEEANVCTKSQVLIAKSKGWTVTYYDTQSYQDYDYEGSEDTDGLLHISIDTSLSDNMRRYNTSGQRVGKTYKGVVIENGKKKFVK